MDAFLLTVGIFLFFGMLGYAVLSLCRPTSRIIQGILLAPTIGLALVSLFIFIINRQGVPLKDFGFILTLALLIFSIITLAIMRPKFPVRRVWRYGVILLTGLVFTAWPMFYYGTNWLSYANEDMANYCLAALRFLNEGYFQPPNAQGMIEGREYQDFYWFLNVLQSERPGGSLIMSYLWATTGYNAHQIFMPGIYATNLCLITSGASLVAGRSYHRTVALITTALLSVSAISILGTLYQLIAQVGGLALFCGAVTLTFQTPNAHSKVAYIIKTIPAFLVIVGLLIWYPELVPFFGISWIVFAIMQYRKSPKQAMRLLAFAATIGIACLLLLGQYLISSFFFLLDQAIHGGHGVNVQIRVDTILFPYFLIPSGFPNFWGLLPIASALTEPFLSILIFIAMVASFFFIKDFLIKELREGSLCGVVSFIMILMLSYLFYQLNDFGLFKLAMFIQPFMLAVLASGLYTLAKSRRYLAYAIAGLFIIGNGITEYNYVAKSTGEEFGGLSEIPHASKIGVSAAFGKFFANLNHDKPDPHVLISDTNNVVLAKYQVLYTKGKSFIFPHKAYFTNFFHIIDDFYENYNFSKEEFNARNNKLLASQNAISKKEVQEIEDNYQTKQFEDNTFSKLSDDPCQKKTCDFVFTNFPVDVFNVFNLDKNKPAERAQTLFKIAENTDNHLMFVSSKLGSHYYFGRSHAAFYQFENDPMIPGETFAAFGRNMLLRVFNPKPNSHLVMELTDTILKHFGSSLPSPLINHKLMSFKGRGSGRVFLDNVEPTLLEDAYYLPIDMNREARKMPDTRSGLMLLYGRNIPQDLRNITSFGRDISLLTDAQYQALTPLDNVRSFPNDLTNKNLEYSGIYEDGWISEGSFFMLKPKPGEDFIEVKGAVPMIGNKDFKTTLHIKLDGVEIASQPLDLGPFDIKISVAYKDVRQRLDLDFDQYQILPGEDGRPSSAIMQFIGFTGAQPS